MEIGESIPSSMEIEHSTLAPIWQETFLASFVRHAERPGAVA